MRVKLDDADEVAIQGRWIPWREIVARYGARVPGEAQPLETKIHITSGFASGEKDSLRRPFVEVLINGIPTQLETQKARELAKWIATASEIADSNGVLIEYLMSVGLPLPDVQFLLSKFRQIRQGFWDIEQSTNPMVVTGGPE